MKCGFLRVNHSGVEEAGLFPRPYDKKHRTFVKFCKCQPPISCHNFIGQATYLGEHENESCRGTGDAK